MSEEGKKIFSVPWFEFFKRREETFDWDDFTGDLAYKVFDVLWKPVSADRQAYLIDTLKDVIRQYFEEA